MPLKWMAIAVQIRVHYVALPNVSDVYNVLTVDVDIVRRSAFSS